MAKDVLSLAWHDMRCRHFATAIKRLESRADVYEENFEYYLALGVACLYVGDIGASSSYFQMARKIKLTDTRLLLGQAAIFLRRGDTARALQYYLEILENDPQNKVAASAMEFIRVHGDYDTICRWADTGRIEQFYPPLGINPEKIRFVCIITAACIAGCVFAFSLLNSQKKYTQIRQDLTVLELSDDEKSEATEKDLSTQSFKFVFSTKEITKRYQNALNFFQNHKDNAAQIEVNYILNSNASLSIKKKAAILMTYFEIPDFDSISDVPSFSDVQKKDFLYLDCWVDWGGKISNVVRYESGGFSCDLLVGDESLSRYEGTVTVYFESEPQIDVNRYVRIIAKISMQDGKIILKGRSVYQSVYN